MNGLDVLQKTKQINPDTEVVLITAYGDDENRRRAMEAGAAEFLTKPVDFDALKTMISNMIDQRGT